MTKGEVDYAIRQALNNLDEWVEATGIVDKGTGYYYEMQAVVEQSVRIGAKIACEGICDISEIVNE